MMPNAHFRGKNGENGENRPFSKVYKKANFDTKCTEMVSNYGISIELLVFTKFFIKIIWAAFYSKQNLPLCLFCKSLRKGHFSNFREDFSYLHGELPELDCHVPNRFGLITCTN